MEVATVAEWIRVDDGGGERWHRLSERASKDGKLISSCGLRTPAEATMDRRPDAPPSGQCEACRRSGGDTDEPKTDMSAVGDDGQVFGG